MRGLKVTLILLLMAGFAQAGIVVTKKGRVFKGKIKANEVKKDSITMHHPRHGNGEKLDLGKSARFKFQRNQIRWFHKDLNDLNDQYWKLHKGKKIDPGFEAPPSNDLKNNAGGVLTDAFGISEDAKNILRQRKNILSRRKLEKAGCGFYPPANWEFQAGGNDIFVMVNSGRSSLNGFPARIHVFSVKSPPQKLVSIDTQLKWYEAAIKRLSEDSKVSRLNGDKEELLGIHNKNITMTTLTTRGSLRIVVRRYIFLRKERVYFVSCYATEKEYKIQSPLFDEFRKNLSLISDQ